MSGWSSGTAITSGDGSFLFFASERCEGPRGVELLGFHSLEAEGRRVLPRPIEPERARNGDEKSGFPPPMKALRRFQRVGDVTRTWGSDGESAWMGEGDGYGGWNDGEGIRGLL
jgi:hypothetical protein